MFITEISQSKQAIIDPDEHDWLLSRRQTDERAPMNAMKAKQRFKNSLQGI